MGNCCGKESSGGGRNDLRKNRTRRQNAWEQTGVVSLRDAAAKVGRPGGGYDSAV